MLPAKPSRSSCQYWCYCSRCSWTSTPLSEQSLFWLFRLSGDFSLGGTTSFRALYPLGPLPLGAFCPFGGPLPFWGPFALHDLLLFESFRLFGSFGVLFLLPAAGTGEVLRSVKSETGKSPEWLNVKTSHEVRSAEWGDWAIFTRGLREIFQSLISQTWGPPLLLGTNIR